MTFLEWLADELNKTDSEEIEIGFEPETDIEEVIEQGL